MISPVFLLSRIMFYVQSSFLVTFHVTLFYGPMFLQAQLALLLQGKKHFMRTKKMR